MISGKGFFSQKEMAMNKRPKFVQQVHVFMAMAIIAVHMIDEYSGHGRLIAPPSRSSAFRFGFPTPPNYDDHELFCGGFDREHNRNGGKCGECGDAWVTLSRQNKNNVN